MRRLEQTSLWLMTLESIEMGSIDQVTERAFTMTIGRREIGDVLVVTGLVSGDQREAVCEVRSFRNGEPVEHRTVAFGDVTIMTMELRPDEC
jgi:hypothetical protein